MKRKQQVSHTLLCKVVGTHKHWRVQDDDPAFSPREMHSTICRGQKLTVFGGRGFSGGNHTVLGTISHFDLGTLAWSEPVQTAMLRCAHAAAPVSATSFAIFGGWSGTPDGIFNSVLIQDESSSEWTEMTISKKLGVEPRFAHSSCYETAEAMVSEEASLRQSVIAESALASSSAAASSSKKKGKGERKLACTLYAFGGVNAKQGLNDLVALSLEKGIEASVQGDEGRMDNGDEGKGVGECDGEV